jgi:hypothetical protein
LKIYQNYEGDAEHNLASPGVLGSIPVFAIEKQKLKVLTYLFNDKFNEIWQKHHLRVILRVLSEN